MVLYGLVRVPAAELNSIRTGQQAAWTRLDEAWCCLQGYLHHCLCNSVEAIGTLCPVTRAQGAFVPGFPYDFEVISHDTPGAIAWPAVCSSAA